jgi:hypothetical protein
LHVQLIDWISKDGRTVAASYLQSPEHWRKRAAELRSIADGLTVLARAQASLLRVAEEYDRLAMRAEHRLNSG